MVTKRSIILEGVTTSICMEPAFWEEIDRRAGQSDMPWQDYVRRLLNGVEQGNNRSAAIRETLMRQLIEDNRSAQSRRIDSWWLLQTPSGQREIGTRSTQLLVGRSTDNAIVVDDPEVSRRHILLTYDGQHWRAVDLGSRNGLLVGGRRREAVRIAPGLVMNFGESSLRLIS